MSWDGFAHVGGTLTLLLPIVEVGDTAHCWVLREQASTVDGGWPLVKIAGWQSSHRTARGHALCGVWLWVCGESWWRVRPYFENCTVDASIFVAKLLRAHGGCLGIRSR